MPYSSGSLQISQRLPAALAQVTLIVQKVGDVRVSSQQAPQQRDMHPEGGQHYIVAQGPPLAAGTDLTLSLSGLPYAPVWPRNLAVALATLILVGGGFAAVNTRSTKGSAAQRGRLESERERLFAQLTTLEASHRAGDIDPDTYARRRRQLVTALERVYAALDEEVAA
jgi:hypothetical protein